MNFIIRLVDTFWQLLYICVLAYVLLSYFLPPTNPIRAFLINLIEPMLNPIRRYVKPFAGIDFSPAILILLIYLAQWALKRILYIIF